MVRDDGVLRLDKNKLKKRITVLVSTEEALRDTQPVEWPEEVVNGSKHVSVKSAVLLRTGAAIKLS